MPTVVVKNDKAVDSLRTEYTRLYSPTTTWGDIVSMNLGYPGLRGYWTMSSVDENIDVYDISGHGRTLSCLAPSVSPSAPPAPSDLLRNSFSYYDLYIVGTYPGMVGSLEYTSPKDVSGIVGTVTNIHTNDGSYDYFEYYPGSIVRNGDYIYLFNKAIDDPDTGPWHSQVMEYQISTGNKNYITFFSSDDKSYSSSGYHTHISIIEERKLLVADVSCIDESGGINHYYAYIIDFDANTCTEQLDISESGNNYLRYLQSACVIKDDGGDIHLLVSFFYMNYDLDHWQGWIIYHKNYTDNTAWEDIITNIDFGVGDTYHRTVYPYIISNNRYLCIPTSVRTNNVGPKETYCIFVYDVLNGTLDYAHGADDLATNYCGVLQAMEDATSHNIYIEEDYNYNPRLWNTYEFDPSTMYHNDTPIASGVLFQSGSNTELFDWASNGDILKTSSRLYKNNSARPAAIEQQSNLMDDSNDSIWYLDGSTLKRYNFSTNTIDKSIATGITAEALGIIHLGDCLVITAQTDSNGYIMDYYLVT